MATKRKNSLVKSFDDLPWLVKLIFCIPGLNILWAIYRIVKGSSTNNTFMMVVGILWIFGFFFCWLIDLISVILFKRPVVFA